MTRPLASLTLARLRKPLLIKATEVSVDLEFEQQEKTLSLSRSSRAAVGLHKSCFAEATYSENPVLEVLKYYERGEVAGHSRLDVLEGLSRLLTLH